MDKKEYKEKRRRLRRRLTAAEATLWNLLKNKQLDGRKFRRQHSVDKYVLDFYCPSENLAIELDGDHHFSDEGQKYDEKRSAYLNSLKIRVLRFENEEVFQSADAVLKEIRKHFNNE